MAGVGDAVRRHRAAIAANLALVLAVSGLVFYAVKAEGYQTHHADLNDGGIWATNPRLGYFGRVNKQIGQYDGAVFADTGDAIDIVQEGSAVVGIDLSRRRLSAIDPATVTEPDDDQASLPADAQVQLAGGTLAVLDARNGKLRASRLDPAESVPSVAGLDSSAAVTTDTGPQAALAVSQSGTVFAVSADDDTLTTLDPQGDPGPSGFGAPRTSRLDVPLGDGVALTSVGQTPVTLDPSAGTLAAVGGARAVVASGSALQQPGPASSQVLVATPSALVTVDLGTGELQTIADGWSGEPAAPVRLGDCVFGAWAGETSVVVTQCGSERPTVSFLASRASDLVFRVNRGEILLNDRISGAVWNLDTDTPTRLEDWQAFTRRDNDSQKDNDKQRQRDGERRPPKARPDQLGARPGRTTVLHPLDNDSAAPGRVLAIRAVHPRSGSDSAITVSPDGQTVQLTLPDTARGRTRFDYVVDDGRPNLPARASVTVTIRGTSQDASPSLRKGYRPRVWPIAAGGTLALPVLPDWRDTRDGDQLSVVTASASDGTQVRPTSDGRLRITASPAGGQATVHYKVGDDRSPAVPADVDLRVLAEGDRPVSAVTQPDIVSVEAGRWVTVRPLANDLPGADPVTPDAELELAGKVGGATGALVRTDLGDGTVRFRAQTPGSYPLDYDAAYGNAAPARGMIRIDVTPRVSRDPVAMPDTATIFGSASTLVDVLANDVDPSGGLLTVQRARAADSGQLDVAVVDGHWVRLSTRSGELRRGPQLVRYSVTNGGRSVTGEITVTYRDKPRDNAPVTQPDRVTVRAGSAVSIPALDNDVSPSGDQLSLVTDPVGERAGQLTVRAAGEGRGQHGAAFVTGRLVRYVAPASLQRPETYDVTYIAANTDGVTAPGQIQVMVLPASHPNRVPEPPLLEGRVSSGGTVTVKLPGSGVDPDGDSVTMLGLASAPTLGRVLKIAATSITYQAYPGSVGTDEFDYLLTDVNGAEATGTVRVGVAPVGRPAPPLALPDTITVDPGRTATLDPLANDVVAPGTQVSLELVDPPAGVHLDSPTGPVTIRTAAMRGALAGGTVSVGYRVSDGLASSQSTITVNTLRGYNNPPVAFDAYAPASRARSVQVDVLRTAYDPDGPTDQLRVTDVYAPAGVHPRVTGSRIRVAKSTEPLVIPFRVQDRDGGATTAQLYVPARDTGLPYVKAGAMIRLDPGESLDTRISQYVVNPAKDYRGPLRFTSTGPAQGSPQGGVQAVTTGAESFTVTAASDYRGPGAVTFEVTDKGSELAPGARRVVLSVPVQVGRDRPVVSCSEDVIPVPQGARVPIPIASVCQVFTSRPEQAAGLTFTADWQTSVDGLSLIEPEGTRIVVAAGERVPVGSEAVLLVRAGDDGEPDRLRLRVTGAAPPTMAPVQVKGLRPGDSRILDLEGYLDPGIPQPVPTVVQVVPLVAQGVRVEPLGGSRVRVAAGDRAGGQARFRVVMSDVARSRDPRRQASNILTVDVVGPPATPRPPQPSSRVRNSEVALTWASPDPHGAPVDGYEVKASNGATQRCPTTSCTFTGLANGTWYTFRVRAHNAVGWSPFSAASREARPDAVPGPVGPIRQVKAGDHTLTLRWTPPTTPGSQVTYQVDWEGHSKTTREPTIFISGLDNTRPYTFTVTPRNAVGPGEARVSMPFQSSGKPFVPAVPDVSATATSSGDAANLVVTWSPVPPNGPDQVLYTVAMDGSDLSWCTGMTSELCVVPGVPYDGATHTFTVQAVQGGDRSEPSAAAKWQAVAPPAGWGRWTLSATGQNREASAVFTVPNSHGSQSTVSIQVDGDVKWSGPLSGGPRTKTFEAGGNDRPHSVQLKVCNETGACRSSDTQQVQTYGPLAGSGITITPETDGTRVAWHVDVDPNGAGARLVIESDQRGKQTVSVPGPTTFSYGTGFVDLGYTTTEHLTVTLDDPVRDRAAVTKTAQVTTPDPPPATVTVKAGSACSDDPDSPRPRCHTGGPDPDCVGTACAFIVLDVAEFHSGVTCTVTSEDGSLDQEIGPIPDGQATETGLYFGTPGLWVKADCRNSDDTRSDTDRLIWPG